MPTTNRPFRPTNHAGLHRALRLHGPPPVLLFPTSSLLFVNSFMRVDCTSCSLTGKHRMLIVRLSSKGKRDPAALRWQAGCAVRAWSTTKGAIPHTDRALLMGKETDGAKGSPFVTWNVQDTARSRGCLLWRVASVSSYLGAGQPAGCTRVGREFHRPHVAVPAAPGLLSSAAAELRREPCYFWIIQQRQLQLQSQAEPRCDC